MSAPRFQIMAGEHDRTDRAPRHGDPDLRLAYCRNGISVWASDHVIAIGGHGIIIGHLFTRTLPSKRRTSLDPHEVDAILRSGGAALLRNFWGGYVALLHPLSGGFRLLRDPSGAMPAFWRTDARGLHVSTHVGDEPFSRRSGVTLDARRLTHFLFAPHWTGADTCLSGVRELLPGHCLVSSGGRWHTLEMWSPWTFGVIAHDSRIDEVVDHLRETVLDCVRSWGDCFPTIVLGLSGGLDSSIVAAGLATSNAAVRCLTMVGPDADGDERRYADAVADALGLPSRHAVYRADDVGSLRPFLVHLPWPTGTQFSQAIASTHGRERDIGDQTAIFTGNGGDMVFCSMQSVTPLLDRLQSFASPLRIWRTATDISQITGADYTTIFRKALHRLWSQNRNALPGGDATFLNTAHLADEAEIAHAHPWLTPPAGSLPGMAAHIAMLKRSQLGLEFYRRPAHPLTVSPLLSQPIVESCLGIPSWSWVRGGHNRAIVREAFAGRLPETILRRRSKGGPGGFMNQIYDRDRHLIASSLADGILRRSGVLASDLDPHAFLAPLGSSSPLRQRLMLLAMAEGWASAWN